MQAILHALTTPIDVEKNMFSKNPHEAVPFLEINKDDHTRVIDQVESMSSPRMIKSHLPYSFLKKPITDKKIKVIVVMRNPKDTLVSFYHFYRINKSHILEHGMNSLKCLWLEWLCMGIGMNIL